MMRPVHILLLLLGFSALTLRADPGPMVLWSATPATSWQQEAYPIGNGKLAAMVFGGVASEQIQFNEDTIWTGQPHDYGNPNATSAHLASIRNKVFNHQDIWSEAQPYLMSVPLRQAMYQPAGTLNLTFPHSGLANYRRSLDLNTATVGVRYDYDGVTYSREVFASDPSNRVIVVRLTASQAAKLSFTCNFSTLQPSSTISAAGPDLILSAKVSVQPRPEYFATGLTNAIEYVARVRVLAEGGTVTAGSGSVSVTNADAVTLLLSVASNFVRYDDLSANPAVICSNKIVAAAANTFPQLRSAQLADYQRWFQRVVLDLGTTPKTNHPTGYRVKRAYEGDDPQLSALYFQMGRYLMIAGSRPGAQPLTLQGKWNDTTAPSWESKMTLNINQFLNYSGAEMVNLSECHAPMFAMIADLAETGAKVARNTYGADGWVVHHNTDLWRGAAPINGRDGIWPAGQAWLSQNLWWHFQYTGDTNFLAKTAYPLMKGAVEFFEDFLIPHRDHTNWLVTNPSYSSEHNWKSNSIEVANVAGPTMDNELLRDLFSYVIQASQLLGVDEAFRSNCMALRDRLPPAQIGKYGQLQEWLEDVDSPDDTHRHCSHLVGLYPGETISPYYTPILAAAAKLSTGWRGIGDIGWGKAWRMGLNARLQNAAFAYQVHTNMLTRDVSTNLMFTDVNNRQVDGIFGALGSVTEFLLQSQSGELFLLPALPPKWTNGLVSGLCARGGFQVDITWQSNRLVAANVRSKLGATCRVRAHWPLAVKLGSNFVNAPMVLPGVIEFPTITGSNYTIVPAPLVETENLSAVASAGDAHQTLTNGAFSNLRGTRLLASAPGDFITYTVTNLAAGTYRIRVVADGGIDHAQFQFAVGLPGALTNLGSVCDTFTATHLVGLYPSNALSAQFLWTNRLAEFDCGVWTAPTNGDYAFRFTVVGKNPASSGYTLSFDHFKLIPEPAPSAPPLERWRSEKFGADTNSPAISGDDADPDGDGLRNLLEYALAREPRVADATNLLTIDQDAGYFTVLFQRAKAATDVTIAVEVSSDLGGAWTADGQPPQITDDGNGRTETVRIRDSVLMKSAQRRFLRLRVARS